MVDRTVLQYQLIEKLGAGGMGEVYKAWDTRLNRFVAMKVLPAGMSADPELRRRFIQEARAASALNHPNIITIYDIVSDGHAQYIVVEYVAGKTLLELIPRDGMRVAQVIPYAIQIADALGAAHAAGIIHRDLKPANVMVTISGLVKLLDFGLAKVIDPALGDDTGNSTTVRVAPLTAAGTLMGTVNYMSPEQVEGRKLDARSDIFSFGAVLYEMLTGRHAFTGSSSIATLSAVLRDDIRPIGELAPDVPFELEQVVVVCLRKDPDRRFQSMQEVQAAFVELKRQADWGVLHSRPARRRASKAVAIGAAFVLAMAAGGGGYYWWMARHRSVPPHAQAGATPETRAPAAPLITSMVLGDGLPIRLTLSEDVPRDAAEGTAMQFHAAEDILVNYTVVIPKGSAATGVIVDGAKKKIFGFGGKMTFRLKNIDAVDGQKVTIRATPAPRRDGLSKRPVDNGANRKSKEVAAAAGTEYLAYIDGANTVLVKE